MLPMFPAWLVGQIPLRYNAVGDPVGLLAMKRNGTYRKSLQGFSPNHRWFLINVQGSVAVGDLATLMMTRALAAHLEAGFIFTVCSDFTHLAHNHFSARLCLSAFTRGQLTLLILESNSRKGIWLPWLVTIQCNVSLLGRVLLGQGPFQTTGPQYMTHVSIPGCAESWNFPGFFVHGEKQSIQFLLC